MVKPEQEKSLTAPLTLPTAGGRKTRKASRTGAAGRLNIVRAQIRLPDDIEEAPATAPAAIGESQISDNNYSEATAKEVQSGSSKNSIIAAAGSGSKAIKPSPPGSGGSDVRHVNKSVASMVRR